MNEQNHPSAVYPTSPTQYVAQQPPIVTAPVNHAPPRNAYQCAKTLDSLQIFPAVIDCPRCGIRETTIATPASGNTQ
jgi:hypothetical protein